MENKVPLPNAGHISVKNLSVHQFVCNAMDTKSSKAVSKVVFDFIL